MKKRRGGMFFEAEGIVCLGKSAGDFEEGAMRAKLFVILFSFSVCLIHLFGTPSRQEQQWKGKIEEEQGVKVVKNPAESLYGEIRLELEEDLSIGKEEDDNYFFLKIRDVNVDAQGNIYVVDMGNYRIQKFDSNGRYLQTIGRQGQGPGEFELPTRLWFDDATGSIFVRSKANAIDLFDPQGNFIKRFTLKNVIYDLETVTRDLFIAVSGKTSGDELAWNHVLCQLNQDGEIVREIAEHPFTVYTQRMSGGILSMSSGYELSILLEKVSPESFVFGYSKEYELAKIDSGGRNLLKIAKIEPYPQFSSEEKKSFRRIPVPKYKPYFFSILSDSEGRIYVQRNMPQMGRVRADTVNKEVDVFGKDGYFIFTTALPPNTCVIRDGKIYSWVVDEDKGTETIKRFRIKNWNLLPIG
jgi:hypothetical protein